MVNGKSLADAGYRYLGTAYSKMDCQAFVEQCLRDCGLEKNLAGSNAWFREVNANGVILTPEECVKQLGTVPPGAFLFIWKNDGKEPEKYRKDGLGNADHIGICTGRGEGAIHSSASRGCVAESKFKGKTIQGGWNRVGLWNRVAYDYTGSGSGSSAQETPAAEDPVLPETSEAPTAKSGTETAVVWAGSGSTVNTRQGPSTGYALSKAGRIPVGTEVEILKRSGGWCRIRVVDPRNAVWYCWMKEEFLKELSEEARTGSSGNSSHAAAVKVPEGALVTAIAEGTPLWTVEIEHLNEAQVEQMRLVYPDCRIRREVG